MIITNEMWITAGLALAAGFLVGFLVAYFGVYKRRKVAKLQSELLEQKTRLAAYREQVDAHFVETSTKFQGLTEQYRALYEHLAEGAQSLCTDRLLAQQLGVIESRPLVEQRSGRDEEAGAEKGAPAEDDPVTSEVRGPQTSPEKSESDVEAMSHPAEPEPASRSVAPESVTATPSASNTSENDRFGSRLTH